jgi:hypothetical protein
MMEKLGKTGGFIGWNFRHFIAHLMRSNARDHANPDSGPATMS